MTMWSIPSARRFFRRGSAGWAPYSAVPTDHYDLESASAASTPRGSISSTILALGGGQKRTYWKGPLFTILGFGFLCVFILVNLDNIPLAWSNFIVQEGWFGGKACEQVVISLNATAATYGMLKSLLSQPGANGVAIDETKILLPERPLPSPRALLQPLQHRLPYHVINQYFETGTLPSEVPPTGPIDIVYTWVNSTSEEFSGIVKERWEGEDLGRLNGERRWRDNGELRGAVHSAVHAFKDSLRKVHIISGDYPVDVVDVTGEDRWSMGQIPAWLDWSKAGKETKGNGPDLKWHFHREMFRLPRAGPTIRGWSDDFNTTERGDVDISDDEMEQEWQDLALPTFNSFAIESRLGFVEGCHENLYVVSPIVHKVADPQYHLERRHVLPQRLYRFRLPPPPIRGSHPFRILKPPNG